MKIKKQKVSIIITTYNSKKNLIKSLRSVLNQSYKSFEIIIVDDHSTDGTKDTFQKFMFKNIKIKYFHLNKNKGVSYARNYGIKKCKHKYIFFLDAGDIWYKNKIKLQLNIMLSLKPDVLCNAYKVYDNKSKFLYDVSYDTNQFLDFEKVIKKCNIGFSSCVINKDQIRGYKFKKVGHEDLDLWLRLLENKKKIYFDNMKLYKYIKYPNSLSSNKLKAATWQFKIVFSRKNINLFQKILYFSIYTFRGVFKFF